MVVPPFFSLLNSEEPELSNLFTDTVEALLDVQETDVAQLDIPIEIVHLPPVIEPDAIPPELPPPVVHTEPFQIPVSHSATTIFVRRTFPG
jgi:hypothetical protein